MFEECIVLKSRLHSNSRRIVSIDYGAKRVGLSLADPLRLFTQPFGVFTPKVAIEKLVDLHDKESIGTIVIGWPLNEDGTEGQATRAVERYILQLRQHFDDVEIVRWDERFTSEEAKSRLAMHKKQKREHIDQVAAGLILQEFLDSISETTRTD